MNGRLIDAFIPTWVHDREKREAVAVDEGTDLNDLAKKKIEARRFEIHVNDETIANFSRLHTEQDCVKQAECTASPEGVCNQSSKRVRHAGRRRDRTSLP